MIGPNGLFWFVYDSWSVQFCAIVIRSKLPVHDAIPFPCSFIILNVSSRRCSCPSPLHFYISSSWNINYVSLCIDAACPVEFFCAVSASLHLFHSFLSEIMFGVLSRVSITCKFSWELARCDFGKRTLDARNTFTKEKITTCHFNICRLEFKMIAIILNSYAICYCIIQFCI